MKDKILIIDIETTHIHYKKGSIVELGATELDLVTHDINTVFNTVCREKRLSAKHREEPYGWIFKNSSLTPEMVRKAPSFEDEVMPKFQDLINKYALGVTAFNKTFDITYLRDRGIKFGKIQDCPMLKLAPIMNLPHKNGRGFGKWPNVEEVFHHYLNIPDYKELHRAGADSFDEAGIISGMIQRGDYKVQF